LRERVSALGNQGSRRPSATRRIAISVPGGYQAPRGSSTGGVCDRAAGCRADSGMVMQEPAHLISRQSGSAEPVALDLVHERAKGHAEQLGGAGLVSSRRRQGRFDLLALEDPRRLAEGLVG
jgi:hypothetical protein